MHSDTGTVIGSTTAALIASEDGTFELLAPDLANGEAVPDAVLALTSLFLRLENEPDFLAEQIEWLTERTPQ